MIISLNKIIKITLKLKLEYSSLTRKIRQRGMWNSLCRYLWMGDKRAGERASSHEEIMKESESEGEEDLGDFAMKDRSQDDEDLLGPPGGLAGKEERIENEEKWKI